METACAGRELELNAWIDGELDAAAARAVEAHLATCAGCRARADALRAISRLVRESAPRPPVPDLLRERIARAAAAERTARRPAAAEGATTERAAAARGTVRRAFPQPRWLSAAAAAVLLAVVAGGGGWLAGARHGAADALADEAVGSHLRSLQPGRLADVPSSDRHQVKPWFAGRLPFSPPVYDFSAQGFPLAGGRVDFLGGRQVAAIAYHRRLHVVNVYVWPADQAGALPADGERLGYHLLSWTAGGFRWLAITDAAADDLRTLRGLVTAAASSPTPPETR